jgi:hypothetical protein
MSLLSETTYQNQYKLAEYCRTGVLQDIPGIKAQHIGQYRRLVYNIIEDSLASSYPLTVNLLTTKEWKDVVHEFFSSHKCASPQVWTMPLEFYEYLVEVKHSLLNKYPQLKELLWMEWLEIQIYMMPDIEAKFKTEGKIEKSKLVLNPEHHIEKFTYPVHLKNAKYISRTDTGTFFLIIHRELDSGKVQFTNISPAIVRFLEVLKAKPITLEACTKQVCTDLQIPFSPEVLASTKTFVEKGLEGGMILGFA